MNMPSDFLVLFERMVLIDLSMSCLLKMQYCLLMFVSWSKKVLASTGMLVEEGFPVVRLDDIL